MFPFLSSERANSSTGRSNPSFWLDNFGATSSTPQSTEESQEDYSANREWTSYSPQRQEVRRLSLIPSVSPPVQESVKSPEGKIVPFRDYLTLPRSASTYLIDRVLPVGGAVLLYGDPKVGKSFAALQMCESLVNSRDWLGFQCHPLNASDNNSSVSSIPFVGNSPPTRSPRVVYIQLDTPRGLWAERLENLERAGLDFQKLLLADRETLNCWPFDILNPEHQVLLRETLLPFEPDVVVVDTLREAHSGDENDSTAMQSVIAALVGAVQPAAIVIVSHSRKPSENGPSLINDIRGSSYIAGRMDAIVHFSENSMLVGGRSIEETKVSLHRRKIPGGFVWDRSERAKNREIAELVAIDTAFPSMRQKAARVASLTGLSESQAFRLVQGATNGSQL